MAKKKTDESPTVEIIEMKKPESKKIENIGYDWWLDTSTQEVWAYTENLFTDDEIDFINNQATKTDTYLGNMGSSDAIRKDLDYRNSLIANLHSTDEDNRWIFERVTGAVVNINKKFWNFDLTRIETLQYSIYNEGQFYKSHIDALYDTPTNAHRKLSFSIQLTDPDEYDGGNLLLVGGNEDTDHGLALRRKKGTIIFFPSYIVHEVTKVTRGTRKTLVGWVTGPAFR